MSTGKHSIVTRIYPYYKDGTVTVAVGTRETQSETPAFTSDVAVNSSAFSPFRAQGRYHRARVKFTDDWDKALGIEVEARDIGRR